MNGQTHAISLVELARLVLELLSGVDGTTRVCNSSTFGPSYSTRLELVCIGFAAVGALLKIAQSKVKTRDGGQGICVTAKSAGTVGALREKQRTVPAGEASHFGRCTFLGPALPLFAELSLLQSLRVYLHSAITATIYLGIAIHDVGSARKLRRKGRRGWSC